MPGPMLTPMHFQGHLPALYPVWTETQQTMKNIYQTDTAVQKKKPRPKKDLSKYKSNSEHQEITTVMIRGIPCSFSQSRMLHILEQAGLGGQCDFFYLPVRGIANSNLGYAFVNFTSAASANACTAALHGVA